MKRQLLRSQHVLLSRYSQSLVALRHASPCFSTTTSDTSSASSPPDTAPKTAFAAQSDQPRRPAPGTSKEYEYPEEKEKSLQSAFDFCVSELQKEEPQIYDTLQYLKCKHDHERLAIMVLRVLHLELSRTRSDANTADAARVRLQWWKSVITELINDKNVLKPLKQSTPLLMALRVVRRRYNLNSAWLLKLVTAREMFLSSNTFMSMLELEEYAECTQTMLLYLSMECLNIAYASSKKNHFECASHLGVLMTIASVLRSIPYSIDNGFIALPDDIAADCDVWRFEQTVLEQRKSTLQLRAAVERMVTCAYHHFYAAKDLEKQGMNDMLTSLFLCSVPAQRYLLQLEKQGFDVFHKKLMEPDMGLSWKWELTKKSMRNTF
eukprot:CAMPEP_0197077220 /NCGR_PEP_ID=MMETSP1384-20130603/212511_1 /TAXON_ID=29189 /ORGANISM="Ammonia sp." /LENGTH=378 /DNA_ID=CAMNT_0042516081 /DNA_START=48 /DNA_END=1184 /DNA_ORIENTATION=-